MAEWMPAESVPEIAAAMAALGGTTVPPDVAMPALAPPTKVSDESKRRMFLLGGTCLGFVLFLLVSVALFGGEDTPAPAATQATPAPRPEAAVPAEPRTPAPDPRIDSVARRPVNWTNQPMRDLRRRSGTAQASSELREGGGKLHGARNLTDFRSSTAWCEGNSQSGSRGKGEGEWIQLATPCVEAEFREVIGLEIVSGFTDNVSEWKQNNRPSKLRLTVTVDGRVRLVADLFLANRTGYQFLEFPRSLLCQRGETVRAKLEIAQLYAGDAFSDACISGLAFYERLR
jgi:hypothetical protein